MCRKQQSNSLTTLAAADTVHRMPASPAISLVCQVLLCAANYLQEPALQAAEAGGAQNLIINLIGLIVFGGLFYTDQAAGEVRVEQRWQIRQAQIRSGDREVFVDDQGQQMSRLKEVGTLCVAACTGCSGCGCLMRLRHALACSAMNWSLKAAVMCQLQVCVCCAYLLHELRMC
jgi:hypothetical protein